MNRSRKKALIIGCGVAGPVVALFLQRAGIEAEIYEARAESTDYGGSFLNMACNGLGVLKALGLDEQVICAIAPTWIRLSQPMSICVEGAWSGW